MLHDEGFLESNGGANGIAEGADDVATTNLVGARWRADNDSTPFVRLKDVKKYFCAPMEKVSV